jgi:type VI secretion system secreted protein Hcp
MAINNFIVFDGVEGDSTATGHEKSIELLSWSHGFSQPTSPTRSGAGAGTVEQANHQNFNFSKYIDSATDDLLKLCWSGKQVPKVTVSCYRADGSTDNAASIKYLEVVMEHVVVSNISMSGGPGDLPMENIALDYGIVQYNYLPQQSADGAAGGNQPVTHNLEIRQVS